MVLGLDMLGTSILIGGVLFLVILALFLFSPKKQKEKYDKVSKSNIVGIALILMGILLFYFKPTSVCSWYEFGCRINSAVVTTIYLIMTIILVIIGLLVIFLKKRAVIIFTLLLTATILNYFIPDFIPFIDEIILTALTIVSGISMLQKKIK